MDMGEIFSAIKKKTISATRAFNGSRERMRNPHEGKREERAHLIFSSGMILTLLLSRISGNQSCRSISNILMRFGNR